MSFRADLFDFVSTNASIIALVGDRVFPGFAATDKPRPYITMERSSQIPIHHMAAGNSVSIMRNERFQFDCWAKNAFESDTVKDALVTLLDGFTGLMNATSDVRRAFMQNALDNHEDPIDGSQVADHRVTVDFKFWYVTVVP